MAVNRNPIIDKIGACASTLCAVHCVLTGVAMSLLAVSGFGFLANPIVEVGFFGVAILVGAWALVHGIKRHHSRWPAVVFALGLASIVGSHIVGHDHAGDSKGPWGTVLAVLGGVLIVGFHVLNSKLQHHGCGCPLDH